MAISSPARWASSTLASKMHEFVLEGLDLVFHAHGLRSIHDLTAQNE